MLPYLFVLLAIFVRFLPFMGPLNLMPHAWHFTPLAASLLFFGARGSRRQMWIPLAMMMATDVALTKFIYGAPLKWDQLVVWLWYAAILWLGTRLHENSAMLRVIVAALASSVSFFVLSNFATWAAWPGMYPRNFGGLMAAYIAAIPFYRNTLVSDLFFSVAFFGTPLLVDALSRSYQRASNRTAAI